nr:molybdate ABC transporter substrate-binding protein [Ruegeria arenilitoris]
MTRVFRCLIAVLAFFVASAAPIRAGAEGVLVFAAASLKTALDAIVARYQEEFSQDVTVSYAASSVLARQIQLGAPAELYISANQDWMDVLEHEGLLDSASRIDLLANNLVLIGLKGGDPIEIEPTLDLQSQLDGGYLAMALVDAVPAGIYGKSALQTLGIWDTVEGQIAQADNVRAALALVATGASPLGIVYNSDATAENRVDVLGTFPQDTHSPIIYPAALMQAASADAQNFFEYLQSEASQAEFQRQGFTLSGQ